MPLKNIIKPRYDIYKSREHITKQLAVSSADFVAVVFVFKEVSYGKIDERFVWCCWSDLFVLSAGFDNSMDLMKGGS